MEWVADWYQIDYYANSPSKNPLGPEDGTKKILRGGAWATWDYGMREFVRVAARFNFDPDFRANTYIGFRCAWSP